MGACGEVLVPEVNLPERARVSVRIYDVAGRLVRVMADGGRPAGRYAESWTGADERGGFVRAGLYFVRLEAGSRMLRKSIVRLE